VSTRWTPRWARAREASIDRMRARACGLRTAAACSTPAGVTSAT
jgi:hypothetical protein